MNIPESAVEAAAKAIYGLQPAKYYLDDAAATWEQLDGSNTGLNRKRRDIAKARAALEAAAPHMMEAAYERGWEDGRNGTRGAVWWQK